MKYTNIIVDTDRLLKKYSYAVINKALLKYSKRVDDRSACGELGNITEPTIKMSNISHLVESILYRQRHKTLYINIMTIDNRPGNRLKDILDFKHEHKFQLRTIERPNSFDIISIDVVDIHGTSTEMKILNNDEEIPLDIFIEAAKMLEDDIRMEIDKQLKEEHRYSGT
jgi:hypothetical protein